MVYKAGGIVTVRLDSVMADHLSRNKSAFYYNAEILSYEPPKEPVVSYFNVYESGAKFIAHENINTANKQCGDDRLECIKLTYDPTTGEVRSEVCK